MSNQQLQPQTFDQMMQYASMVAKSGLVPQDYQGSPENCLIAMQWGSELGMSPLQALQNIAVINGRASIWGDMLPALVKSHPSYEWMTEEIEYDDNGKVTAAVCTGKRKNHDPESRKFTIAEAQMAGLLNKKGPWQQYPKRMLQMRARSWLCRDLWPDALRGMAVAEEVRDIPSDERVVNPEPEPLANTPERQKAIAELEACNTLESLKAVWKNLTKEQRYSVGRMGYSKIYGEVEAKEQSAIAAKENQEGGDDAA